MLFSSSLHFGAHDLIKQDKVLRRFRGKILGDEDEVHW